VAAALTDRDQRGDRASPCAATDPSALRVAPLRSADALVLAFARVRPLTLFELAAPSAEWLVSA
jgi:hypothetical protein